MKKALILFSLVSAISYGQNYSVSSFSNTYSDLLSPQILTTTVWDDPTLFVVSNFPVSINGNGYDTLMIDGLGCTISGVNGVISNRDGIDPSGIDIIDRGYDAGVSQSNISYDIDGFIGNRILKIQWKNVGSYGEYDVGGNSMSINFQLWFYEQGKYIEVRYGSSNVSDANVFLEGEIGVGVAIVDDINNLSPNDSFLTGITTFPSITNVYSRMNGIPQNGQVYRFAPTLSIGVDELNADKVAIFPNPCADKLNFTAEKIQEYAIYHIDGKLIKEGVIASSNTLDISDVSKGNYLLVLTNIEGEIFHSKFIKE